MSDSYCRKWFIVFTIIFFTNAYVFRPYEVFAGNRYSPDDEKSKQAVQIDKPKQPAGYYPSGGWAIPHGMSWTEAIILGIVAIIVIVGVIILSKDKTTEQNILNIDTLSHSTADSIMITDTLQVGH